MAGSQLVRRVVVLAAVLIAAYPLSARAASDAPGLTVVSTVVLNPAAIEAAAREAEAGKLVMYRVPMPTRGGGEGGGEWTVRIVGVDRPVAGGVSIWGDIEGDERGSAVVTVRDGQIAGGVWTARGAFGVSPTGRVENGLAVCELISWEPGGVVRCLWDGTRPALPEGFEVGRAEAAGAGIALDSDAGRGDSGWYGPRAGACDCHEDDRTIDVLSVYTTLAKNAAGGAAAIQARVQNGIASANAALANSIGPPLSGRPQLNLVGFMEVAYDEVAPDWINHLQRLTEVADGFMDAVHPQRNALKADLVTLAIDDTRFTGGAAWWSLWSDTLAFSTLNWRSMGSGNLTLPHELGHNFGCAHDRENDASAPFPFAWGYSFADASTTYGTIMAYPGAVRLPYYSNPNLSPAPAHLPVGVPLNQPRAASNATMILHSARTLANFRDSGRPADCNANGRSDAIDVALGSSADVNADCQPDECQLRLYVDANNPLGGAGGDGLSWANAMTDLGTAVGLASLSCSRIGEIWVADGMYRPGSGSTDRYSRFELRSGLTIRGGFQGASRPGGGESSPAQRVPGFVTVLSGDIGVAGLAADNAYSVVLASGVVGAVVDGVTIEGGNSASDGAGAWISDSSVGFTNCVFRDNNAYDGALACVGASVVAASGCVFTGNSAAGSGGAVIVRDGATATFTTLGAGSNAFLGNSAGYGGAVHLFNGASASFQGATFTGNTATGNGGAIDCYVGTALSLDGCAFLLNAAGPTGGGGAASLYDHAVATVTACLFSGGEGPGTGGAVWADAASRFTATGSVFEGNSTSNGGGAVSAYGASAISLSACRFVSNTGDWGGAVAAADASLTATACDFVENTANTFHGGAFDLFNTNTLAVNCVVAHNTAGGAGAISAGGSSITTLVNCSIADNAASGGPGGVSLASDLTLVNSILWGNSGSFGTLRDRQLYVYSGTVDARSSCVQGFTPEPPFAGATRMTASDPGFADPAASDYTLADGSPVIDAGDNSAVPVGVTTDRAGMPRFEDDPATADTGVGTAPIVDMGAFEHGPTNGCIADFDGSGGTPDASDIDAFFNAWLLGDPAADVDLSGGTPDSTDIDVFFQHWLAGC